MFIWLKRLFGFKVDNPKRPLFAAGAKVTVTISYQPECRYHAVVKESWRHYHNDTWAYLVKDSLDPDFERYCVESQMSKGWQ